MSLKPKTSRRLALAAVLLVLAVGSVVAFVFVRQWQRERAARTARAEGLALFEQGRYVNAAERLRASLRHNFADAEAWRVFGECWEKTELPDLKNLHAAKDAYSRVYDLDPGDRATAVKLLSLYNRVGLYQEALTHAGRLRPPSIAQAGEADFDVLREEAAARTSLKLFDDRLGELADRMLALRPDDFGANAIKAAHLRENGRGGEALTLARGAAERFPDNRGLQLLRALVTFQESGSGDTSALFASACEAAGLDAQTGAPRAALDSHNQDLVFRFVSLFDSLSRFEHSESLLRAATAPADADPDVLRLSIRRTWQVGRNADVASRLADLDLGPGGAHSDLIAFKAMALRDLGRRDELPPLIEALKSRTEIDYRAKTWSLAFEAVPGMTGGVVPTPAEGVQKLRAALKESPAEPAVAMFLGQALFSLGRTEEAFEAFKTATDSAPSWAAPFIELSRACLNEGRAAEAFTAAEHAMRAFPSSLAANVTFLNAQSAVIESGTGNPGDPADLARRLETAAGHVERVDDPEARRSLRAGIVPARAVLAVRAGRPDEAREIVRAVLAEPGEPDRALLRRLALLSAREGLGLEAERLARADEGAEPTPSSVFARAMTLHHSGRTAEGADLIRATRDAASAGERAGWARAYAQYLDAAGDPAALDAWKDVCDSNPSDLSIQLAALRAPGAARDMAFVERLTERVNRLSSVDPERPLFVTRLARARALLEGPPSVRARDEAVTILRALSLEAGDGYEVRSLLVTALLTEDQALGMKADTQGALELLRTMQPTAPDKALISLQIGSILQRQREFDRAREELRLVAEDGGAKPELRQRAIDMLIAQADFAGAVGPFASLLEHLGERAEPARWLKLAAVHRALKQDARALEVYRRLAALPPADAESLVQVADGLASVGQREEGERTLAHLDAMTLEPGQRELAYATFWARRGEHSRAEEFFEKAVTAAPDRAEPWVRYAQFVASRSEFERAEQVVGRGLDRLPDNPELRVVRQQLTVRRAEGDNFSMSDFASELEALPENKARAEIIRVVDQMRRDGRLETAKGIDEMRAKFPDDMSVQTLAVRLYGRLKPARPDLAAATARDAMASFPTAAQPAMLAAELFREQGDWPETLKAARRWQQLTRSAESDLAVAEAHLNLNQPLEAMEVLRPLVQSAASESDSPVASAALTLQARALASGGRAGEALDLLRPRLKDSPELRTGAAIPIAVLYVRPDADAVGWLETVEALLPPDDADGRLALAMGWAALAGRSSPARQDLFDRGIAVLSPLTAHAGASSAPAHEAVAAICRQRGDSKGAVEAYRRALASDERRVPALLGLCDLLLASGGDAAEAVALAERAVNASGPQAAVPRRVLGRALASHAARLEASGRGAEAISSYRRAAEVFRALAAADPGDLAATLGLANVSDSLGDLPTSIVSYERALGSRDLNPQTRAGIQNNLAYALLRSGKDSAALDRARTLASEAVAAAEVGAFFDTLGCVEAARGDRGAAVRAFTRAIELDPKMNGSRVELAALLAPGSADDKARAITLLDEAVKAGTLTAEQQRRAEEVRTQLQKPN